MRGTTRWSSVAASFIIIGAAAVQSGCASARGRSGPVRPVELDIENNLTVPTDLSVYAIRVNGGARQIIGDVPPATTKAFQFTPDSYSEVYRLVASGPNGRAIRSQSFIVGYDMTGQIIWTLVPNIIGFRDTGTDSTSH